MGVEIGVGVVASGFAQLLVSQLSTRLVSFLINLIIARHLSPEAYGLSAVQFHLITSTILLLSREGLRRGCLRFRPDSDKKDVSVDAKRVLSVAWLSIPAGLLVGTTVVFGVLKMSDAPSNSPYRIAVVLHGLASILELAAEPFYALALVNLQFKLRAGVDTCATLVKSCLTLFLVSQTQLEPAIVFSVAQIAFAVVTLLAYLFFTGKEAWRSLQRKDATIRSQPFWGQKEREVLWMSGLFTFQSMEKQVLAEGSKMVLVAFQSQYNQGVYGLVGNLGSLLVRLLLQPLEEIAFATFSRFQVTINENKAKQSDDAEGSMVHLAHVLGILVKSVILVGLISASFGPSYSYTLIRLVYGSRWSETEAPIVLAYYSVYILLLAVNGVTEAFVHAVLDARGIQQTNALLVAFSLIHLVASVVCINLAGAVGLVVADSINMILRISCSFWYINKQFKMTPGFKLSCFLPRPGTLIACAIACGTCLASEHYILNGYIFSNGSSSLEFLRHASGHIAVGIMLLSVVTGALVVGEWDLISGFKSVGSIRGSAKKSL